MAVTNVTEIANGRSGGDSVEKGPNGVAIVTREFSRSFIVETDSPNDGWDVIKRSLPDLSTIYQSGNDFDNTAKVVSRRGTQRDNARKFWDCEVEYSTESPSDKQGGESESEEVERELRQSIRWSTASVAEALTKDIDGVSILNAAEDPFEVSHDIPIYSANITRYERQSTFSAFPLDTYFNAINEDTFILDGKVIEARWALFGAYDASDVVLGSQQAKQVAYTINIWPFVAAEYANYPNFSKWDAFLLEHGPNYIDANGVKRASIVGGHRINVNLDADTGNKLAITAPAEYSHFKTRKRATFSSLGFRQ